MLSELGKFGASFILATQSLAKLEELSRTMQSTLLANVDCLAVFQVAGTDARTLMVELGKERISEEDITSLPVHHCYVQATVGAERLPAFSMTVRKPEVGDPRVAARIRSGSETYTTRVSDISFVDIDSQALVQKYRDGLHSLRNRDAVVERSTPDAQELVPRRKVRSRHGTAEENANPDAAVPEEEKE